MMYAIRSKNGKAMSMPGGLAFGLLISGGVTVLMTAVLAKLLDMEKIQWPSIGYWIMAMLLIASFLGAQCASQKVKRRRLLVCFSSGGVFYLFLLGVTALFFGGQYEAAGVTGALIFAGSMCSALINFGEGKGNHRQIRKIHR